MHNTTSTSFSDFLLGARDILPMAVVAATYGAAFGVLAMQSDFSLLQTLGMSGFVYAGASQMLALDQFVAGAGVVAAVLAAAALNTRFLLITASMQQAFMHRPWWQIAAGVFLATDASVMLMQTARNRGALASYWYLFGGGFLLLVIWIIATLIGALLSAGIPDPAVYGLDFAIVAVFVASLPGLWRGYADIVPWMVAAGIVAGFVLIVPEYASWGLLSGALFGAITAGLRHE